MAPFRAQISLLPPLQFSLHYSTRQSKETSAVVIRDVNFVFFPEIDFRFEKIDFFPLSNFGFVRRSQY